jgi:hypothetical protein
MAVICIRDNPIDPGSGRRAPARSDAATSGAPDPAIRRSTGVAQPRPA